MPLNEKFRLERKRRNSLLESEYIPYDVFTRDGQRLVDTIVKNLISAKQNLENLIYGRQIEYDDETINATDKLMTMHKDICKMLDKLPW